MKLKFRKDVIFVINGVLRTGQQLAMSLGTSEYKAKDRPAAKQLTELRRWMEERVLKKRKPNEVELRQAPNLEHVYDFVDYEGALPKSHVDRLKDVLKTYKDMGLHASSAEGYWEVVDILDGKDPEKYDDLEALAEEEAKEKTDIEGLEVTPEEEAEADKIEAEAEEVEKAKAAKEKKNELAVGAAD